MSQRTKSQEIDQRILDFAVQLQLLPKGGSMRETDSIMTNNDYQIAVVHWIEHNLKTPPRSRSMGRIVYDSMEAMEAMEKMGLDDPTNETKADEKMGIICSELRSGKLHGKETPLSTADRLSRLEILSAMTGKAGFGVNLKHPKRIYHLFNQIVELSKGSESDQNKAERFFKLLDYLQDVPSPQQKIQKIEEIIQCIADQQTVDRRSTSTSSKDFFDACFDRIEGHLHDEYKKHIKTLESELGDYKKYLENLQSSQSDKELKEELGGRIKQCYDLIEKCKSIGPIEYRLKYISDGIKSLEKDLVHGSKIEGLPFEKPSQYGGLHSTLNAFLDLVAKVFPSVANYKITGLSTTKSFEQEEIDRSVQRTFKR